MIEQNPARGMQPEGLAIVDRDVMGVELGDGIGAARVKGRLLVLGRDLGIAEQLGRRGLVEPSPGAAVAQRLQDAGDRQPRHLAGVNRLLEGGVDGAVGGEVVDLVRGRAIEDTLDLSRIGEFQGQKLHVIRDLQPFQAGAAGGALGAMGAEDLVALAQQQACQISAVLAGHPGDQRYSSHAGRLDRTPAQDLQRSAGGNAIVAPA